MDIQFPVNLYVKGIKGISRAGRVNAYMMPLLNSTKMCCKTGFSSTLISRDAHCRLHEREQADPPFNL